MVANGATFHSNNDVFQSILIEVYNSVVQCFILVDSADAVFFPDTRASLGGTGVF